MLISLGKTALTSLRSTYRSLSGRRHFPEKWSAPFETREKVTWSSRKGEGSSGCTWDDTYFLLEEALSLLLDDSLLLHRSVSPLPRSPWVALPQP